MTLFLSSGLLAARVADPDVLQPKQHRQHIHYSENVARLCPAGMPLGAPNRSFRPGS
jgi:hypothetical protein